MIELSAVKDTFSASKAPTTVRVLAARFSTLTCPELPVVPRTRSPVVTVVTLAPRFLKTSPPLPARVSVLVPLPSAMESAFLFVSDSVTAVKSRAPSVVAAVTLKASVTLSEAVPVWSARTRLETEPASSFSFLPSLNVPLRTSFTEPSCFRSSWPFLRSARLYSKPVSVNSTTPFVAVTCFQASVVAYSASASSPLAKRLAPEVTSVPPLSSMAP